MATISNINHQHRWVEQNARTDVRLQANSFLGDACSSVMKVSMLAVCAFAAMLAVVVAGPIGLVVVLAGVSLYTLFSCCSSRHSHGIRYMWDPNRDPDDQIPYGQQPPRGGHVQVGGGHQLPNQQRGGHVQVGGGHQLPHQQRGGHQHPNPYGGGNQHPPLHGGPHIGVGQGHNLQRGGGQPNQPPLQPSGPNGHVQVGGGHRRY